jgi:hypothetical protein
MLIPKFWARAEGRATSPGGKEAAFVAWGGSRDSIAAAEASARATIQRIADRIRRGEGFPSRYSYGDRPLREEILREYTDEEGEMVAAITRNSYGAAILNTARVAFIDVDLPPNGSLSALASRIRDWLGGKRSDARSKPMDRALEQLERWMEHHPSWHVRVYRTRSGLRYLVTHRTFAPQHTEIRHAMEALGADPQYRNLCNAQKSFRARLTPKPWRIGLKAPPHALYPRSSPDAERSMEEWLASYQSASREYATCRFHAALGSQRVDPDIVPFVELHDALTKASANLPLA